MKNALGDWSVFSDSDDYFMEDSLNYLENAIKTQGDNNLIVFGYYEEIEFNCVEKRNLYPKNSAFDVKSYISQI